MAIRPVRMLGDPILRARCEPVKNVKSPAVRVVADDLQDTLRDLKRRHGTGRGLAAPQIGAPMRIIYIEADEPTVLINPVTGPPWSPGMPSRRRFDPRLPS